MTYEGWSNRETWAIKLHWDNNEGDYNFFTGEAKRFKNSGRSISEFADFLKDTAEEIQDIVINRPEEASKEARLFILDVGSLWRVDWDEIADAYYDEV